MKLLLFLFIASFSFGQDTLPSIPRVESKVVREIIDLCDTYIEANFPGGNDAMMEYVVKNLSFLNCEMNDFNGKVYIRFTVEVNGDLSDISVFKAPCPEMEQILFNLFDKMPAWSPASDAKHGALKSHQQLPLIICYR